MILQGRNTSTETAIRNFHNIHWPNGSATEILISSFFSFYKLVVFLRSALHYYHHQQHHHHHHSAVWSIRRFFSVIILLFWALSGSKSKTQQAQKRRAHYRYWTPHKEHESRVLVLSVMTRFWALLQVRSHQLAPTRCG